MTITFWSNNSSKERDRETGLSDHGARLYDAQVGVWESPDKARQFANLFSYGVNPVNGVDLDGNAMYIINAMMWGPDRPSKHQYAITHTFLATLDINGVVHTYGFGPLEDGAFEDGHWEFDRPKDVDNAKKAIAYGWAKVISIEPEKDEILQCVWDNELDQNEKYEVTATGLWGENCKSAVNWLIERVNEVFEGPGSVSIDGVDIERVDP